MNNAARDWLEARAGAAPLSLRNAMDTALAAGRGEGSVAAVLCDAAMHALESALQAGDDRAAALHLLAADALLTAACEAAVDDPGEASEVAQRFGTKQLATMFAAHLSADRA